LFLILNLKIISFPIGKSMCFPHYRTKLFLSRWYVLRRIRVNQDLADESSATS